VTDVGLATEAARGSAIRLGAEALCRLFGLATVLLIAIGLGPAGFGTFALLSGLAMVLAQLGDLGFQGITCRVLVARSVSLAALVRAKVLLALSTAAVAGLLMSWGRELFVIMAPLLPPGAEAALRAADAVRTLGLLLLAFTAVSGVAFLGVVLRARRRPVGEGVVLAGLRGTGLVAVALALGWGAGLPGLALAELVSAVPWLIVGAMLVVRTRKGGTDPPASRLRDALRAGAPLAANNVLALVSLRLEVGVLFCLRGPVEAGLFAAALKAVESLLAIPGALAAGALPALTREALSGEADAARTRTARTVMIVAVPLALILALGAAGLGGVLGPEYSAIAPPLRILAFAVLPLFANTVLLHTLIAAGRADRVPWLTAGRLLLAAVLAVPLVTAFGATGAAAGFLSAEVLLLMVAHAACRGAGVPVRLVASRPREGEGIRAARLGVGEVRP